MDLEKFGQLKIGILDNLQKENFMEMEYQQHKKMERQRFKKEYLRWINSKVDEIQYFIDIFLIIVIEKNLYGRQKQNQLLITNMAIRRKVQARLVPNVQEFLNFGEQSEDFRDGKV